MGNGHSILFFFCWAMIWVANWAQIWQGLTGPVGLGRGGSEPQEKNPVSKRAGFGPWAKTRGSGSSMEKSDPNPTHCHSYSISYFEP